MRRISHSPIGLAAALLLCFAQTAFAANDTLVFSPPPSDNPATYQPLLDLVAKSSGKKVVTHTAANYVEYAKNMRSGSYDIAFDGAQFAAWRIAHLSHAPVARLPGATGLVIAVRPEGPQSINEIASGRKVCLLPTYHLSTLAFQQLFTNPARQPHIIAVSTTKDLLGCLQAKRADAAVFPKGDWDMADKGDLRTLTLPERTYPERTLTISGKIDSEARAKITAALLSDEGTKALAPMLKEWRVEKLIAAEAKEYQGLEALLQGTWGFQ